MNNKVETPVFNYTQIALVSIAFVFLCRPIMLNPEAVLAAVQQGESLLAFLFANLLSALTLTLPVSLAYVYYRKNYPKFIRYLQYSLLALYLFYGSEFLQAMFAAYRYAGNLNGFFGFFHAYLLIMFALGVLYLYAENKPEKTKWKIGALTTQSLLYLLLGGYAAWQGITISAL